MKKEYSRINEQVAKSLEQFPDFTIRCKLNEILDSRGMTKKELSQLTGLRPATITEISKMTRIQLSLPHVLVIAKVLRIKDISDLYEFVMSDETKEQFERDAKEIDGRGMTEEQEEYLIELNKK